MTTTAGTARTLTRIAHRGGGSLAPENSVEGIGHSLAYGVEMIEVDVRRSSDGVLVLSEFTGAAAELKEALLVNPHDIDGLKAAVARALTMPREESSRRMRSLRRQVLTHDVDRWAHSFLDALGLPQ